MGFFDVFKKKECDICGGEIGLLGNRKLEDGNLCKVGPPEDPAFFYLAKRRKHHPDIILVTFLRNHSYEQFSVFHG